MLSRRPSLRCHRRKAEDFADDFRSAIQRYRYRASLVEAHRRLIRRSANFAETPLHAVTRFTKVAMEDIGLMKGISGAGNPSSLTNFDAHARPNKIYALDVCSVLTSFRDPLEWRREGEPARLVSKTETEDEEGREGRERGREDRTGVGSSLHDVATRLSTRRLALIKSLDPS